MEGPGRLLLVDDEQSFREPTAEMLRRRGLDCVVAGDADAARGLLRRESFDVIVSDVRMPGNQGFQFVQELSTRADGPAVIVVTGYPSVDTAVDSIDLRVFSYLIKPVDLDVLAERVDAALRQVRLRRTMGKLETRLAGLQEDVRTIHGLFQRPLRKVDSEAVQGLVEETSRTLRNGLRDLDDLETTTEPLQAAAVGPGVDLRVLSPRELEVLDLIRNGYRVATIARRLFISPHTVRNHLKRIFLKLEVSSQAELLEKLKPLEAR